MQFIAVSVGNTRTRLGVFEGRSLDALPAVVNADADAIPAAARDVIDKHPLLPIVMASVNDPIADAWINAFRNAAAARASPGGSEARPDPAPVIRRFGRGLSIPMPHALPDAATVGQDRLLAALGAYARAQQACIVIDAGTAITVDFVDGAGVFQGGAIGPGVNMMLRALHEQTAALPALRFEPPSRSSADAAPFATDTRSAMLAGVVAAARGMVRLLIDQYAEHYEAYPQIIATGGDAAALFESDGVVEHIVPDLVLVGMQAALERLAEAEDDDDAPTADGLPDDGDRG